MMNGMRLSDIFALLAITLGVVYPVVYLVYTLFLSPLSRFKGPVWASITQLWLAQHVLKGDMHHLLPQLHKRYGKFVRITPDTISISDPEAIKIVYNVNAEFTKTDFYEPFAPAVETPLGPNFPQKDEKKHGYRRRIVNQIYTITNVLRSEQYLDHCTSELTSILQDYADKKQIMDLGEWISRYTFDAIGELYYGEAFGFLKERRDVGNYLALMDQFIPAGTLFAVVPMLNRLKPTLTKLIPSAKKNEDDFMKINQLAKDKVEERARKGSSRTDMLANLFSLQQGHPDYTPTEMVNDSFDAVTAGSDTTAVALKSIFYNILKSPAIYQRLQSEIEEADRAGKLSSPVRYNEAIQLPYLAAVCKEGMRVCPSVGWILPRYVPRGGREISGTFFPEGTRVGMSAFVIHQDKTVFGHDAEHFVPERWFRDNAKIMDRYMFQFGAGTRTCIGKNISLCEMHKLVPELLRHFTFRLAQPDREMQTKAYWFMQQTGLNVLVEKRSHD